MRGKWGGGKKKKNNIKREGDGFRGRSVGTEEGRTSY